MGSPERTKRKIHLLQRATVHFLICFLVGFFSGFTPTGKPTIFSSHGTMLLLSSGYLTDPMKSFHQTQEQNISRILFEETETAENKSKIPEASEEVNANRLIIVVTPTGRKDNVRGVLLRKLANTLKLVSQPLLWIVVEQQSGDSEVSEILRKTGIMYRHIVSKENFSDVDTEADYQRNLALNHIEHHRLSGIVHFAGLSNVYDLSLFEGMRAVEAFVAWPVAKLFASNKKVVTEGPVCDYSEVIGWHLKQVNNTTDTVNPPPLHISSFAFNSSILWDPERWGRTSSIQDNSQTSLCYVKKEVLEEETKVKGIQGEGCSKVLIWDLQV